MPPKNSSKANSASKKRSRVTIDQDDASEPDEVLPSKTTKRTYAYYNPVDSKPAGQATTTAPEKTSTRKKPAQKTVQATEDKDDDSTDEPLKRRPRPKSKTTEVKGSHTASEATTAVVPSIATTKETTKAKSSGGKTKNGEASSVKASISNSSSSGSQSSGNGGRKSGKKQPLTTAQRPSDEFENQENREQPSSSPEEQIVVKKTKSQRSQPSMSFEQLQAAYEDLKGRYSHLTSLRTTEAEQHLEEYRYKLQAANRELEQYRTKVEPQLEVRTLQHQLREYEAKEKQRAMEDRTRERTVSMEKLLASPDVNRQSASFVKAMETYQNLTGLKVTACNQHLWGSPSATHPSKIHPETWECEHSGPLGTLRFSLSYDSNTDLVTYVPSIDRVKDAKLLQALPEYMTVEIEFERQFESKLFWRILNYNHDQDDES
ncbi:hypothetical protein DFQ26_005022 [Actinomortierella ambigua]|nr:hypothetical protein DFQ26_005022 [Actinomortierella ambigua]